MSSLKVHTIQSVVTSTVLYPFLGENVVPFGLAVILVDLDHVIEYVRDTRSFDLRGVFLYSKVIEKNLDKNFLIFSAFHTFEFLALILALTLLYPKLLYVFAGIVYHLIVDIYYLAKLRSPFAKAFSVVEYLYRSRNAKYILSIKELVQQEDLNTAGLHNFHHWPSRWGVNKF